MEYNPVAINEVLAYSISVLRQRRRPPGRANRFFLELVNTLTSPELNRLPAHCAVTPASAFDASSSLPRAGSVYRRRPLLRRVLGHRVHRRRPLQPPDPYRGQLVPTPIPMG